MKLIPLTGEMGRGKFVKVDDEDYDFLMRWSWWYSPGWDKNGYAASQISNIRRKRISVMMHRLLMKMPSNDFHVDHIDHDGLNNQKSNLRICTETQNNQNRKSELGSSIYKGVSRSHKKWVAQIQVNRKKIHLGMFKDEESAALAYNQAAQKHHGEFASLNAIKNQRNGK